MLETLTAVSWFVPALHFFIKLMLCIAIGFVVGLEREARGKDAGVSTHSFVIMGAMLFTSLSAVVDPLSTSRISAQIVTGIGFLGAGLIFKDGASVRNLTTAAGLWCSAAIGMAIGYDYYALAVMSAIGSLIVARIPHVLEKKNT